MPAKDEIGVIYIPKVVQSGGKLGPEVLEIVVFWSVIFPMTVLMQIWL